AAAQDKICHIYACRARGRGLGGAPLLAAAFSNQVQIPIAFPEYRIIHHHNPRGMAATASVPLTKASKKRSAATAMTLPLKQTARIRQNSGLRCNQTIIARRYPTDFPCFFVIQLTSY